MLRPPRGRAESQVTLDNSSRVTATTLQELGNLGRDRMGWEGFPESEASGWPTTGPLFSYHVESLWEALTQLHSALEGWVGYELWGFIDHFQASCPQGSDYVEDKEFSRCQWECLALCPCSQRDAGPGTHADTQLHRDTPPDLSLTDTTSHTGTQYPTNDPCLVEWASLFHTQVHYILCRNAAAVITAAAVMITNI